MPTRDPIAEFLAFNRPFAQRHPDLYRMKIARMADGPFAFFRGTFHLYARDVIDQFCTPIPLLSGQGIEMPLVGDIHGENYGTYKAADRHVYYDVNDFDETTSGRIDLDVCRLAISFFLSARECRRPLQEAVSVVLHGILTYVQALPRFLKKGKPLVVSEAAPSGAPVVDQLIARAAALKRTELIERLTVKEKQGRQMVRTARYFNLPDDEREQALRLLTDYAARMPRPSAAGFYRVEDLCGRISGIGSMGRLRYVVLVAGKGSTERRNVLLEFKESRPSAYDLFRDRQTDAAALRDRAEAVITRQRQLQAASSEALGYAVDGAQSFQVRDLGPATARIDFKTLKSDPLPAGLAAVQATILARVHARAAALAVGPVNPLADLGDPELYCQRVLTFALAYADQVRQDWSRFVGSRGDLEKWRGDTPAG